MSSNLTLLVSALILLFGSGLLALACTKASQVSRWIASVGGIVGSVMLLMVGVVAMNQSVQNKIFSIPYFLIFGEGAIRLDPFAGVFLALLGGISAIACLYGLGYSKVYSGKQSLGWLGAMTSWFIASMALVVVASHALTFLFAWEIMALTSFALVVYQHSDPKSRRAGFMYAVMTHIGTACLILAFILFSYHTNSFYFNDWNSVSSLLTPSVLTATFLLVFVGFGTKAGLVPMHMWLPEAHPQAPSHISALMSGVMLKIAVYGFFRIFGLALSQDIPTWWGLLVMLVGAASAVVGVFYAIERRDIKKALAFSSIENIGIIFIGIGASLYFLSIDHPAFAMVAALAALLHTLNHAVLKSLLFLGAGSVYYSFHTRSMDWLGGVAKILPMTSVVFLVGAVGLMGLPPLNAFASEWLVLQTLLNGFQDLSFGARFIFPLVLSAFALAAGLAFVVFTRMFGIVFLGLPRKPIDPHHPPTRTPVSMQVSLVLLAVSAIGISIFMHPIIQKLLTSFPKTWFSIHLANKPEVQSVVDQLSTPLHTLSSGAFAFGTSFLVPCLLFVGITSFTWLVVRLIGGKNRKVIGPSWDCGFPLNERMQYSGLGFTSPVRHALRFFLRPHEKVSVIKGQDNFYFWHERSYTVTTLAFFESYIIHPITRVFIKTGKMIKKVQSGYLHIYVAYVLVALLVLLLLAKYL